MRGLWHGVDLVIRPLDTVLNRCLNDGPGDQPELSGDMT
jgi:hypothetical protein